MSRMSNNLTRVLTLAAILMVTLMSIFGVAYGQLVAGRKYVIDNINQADFDGELPCPQAYPNNTISFFSNSSDGFTGTVELNGEFDATLIGVCSDGSVYAIPPGTPITYEVYGNLVVLRISDRGSTAFNLFYQENTLYALEPVGNYFYASILTDVGAAVWT